MARLRITLRRSIIGQKQNQKDTVRSLGLTRRNQTVEKEATPSIRGMVQTVSHLVEVEEIA